MADSLIQTPADDRRPQARPAFRKVRRDDERVRLLGQAVDLVRPEEVLLHLARCVREGRRTVARESQFGGLGREPLAQQQLRVGIVLDDGDGGALVHRASIGAADGTARAHSDPCRVSTITLAGYQPYLGAPTIRWGSVNPVTGAVDIGYCTVPVADIRTGC